MPTAAARQFLASHSNQLQHKLVTAHHEIERRDNLIAAQNTRLEAAKHEIDVLTRALEVRGKDLGVTGKGDVRKGLLYAVRSLASALAPFRAQACAQLALHDLTGGQIKRRCKEPGGGAGSPHRYVVSCRRLPQRAEQQP